MEIKNLTNEAVNEICGKIGYVFTNPSLLSQAFTRSTFTEEHGGENNEVLEFIGDKALDLSVVYLLATHFGKIDVIQSDEGMSINFTCRLHEGDLTALKASFVNKNYQSERIDKLFFTDYLIQGNGDIKQKISEQLSVKSNLFEAIIGAVALDCNWNFYEIVKVSEKMLDFSNNIVPVYEKYTSEKIKTVLHNITD